MFVVGSGPGGAKVTREVASHGWKLLIPQRGQRKPVTGTTWLDASTWMRRKVTVPGRPFNHPGVLCRQDDVLRTTVRYLFRAQTEGVEMKGTQPTHRVATRKEW